MRKTVFALILFVCSIGNAGAEPALPQKGRMQVQVVKLSGSPEKRIFVSTGVPFAQGQMVSEGAFAVFDDTDKEFSVAVKVLARWPQDGSIRALLVQFPYEVEKRFRKVAIQWGVPAQAKRLAVKPISGDYPTGYLLLPPKWLCLSGVAGPQVPYGQESFRRYDENIERVWPFLVQSAEKTDEPQDIYYDLPHVLYQWYVRTGEEQFFVLGRKELLRYRSDIITEGKDRGRHKAHAQTRYTYVQAMADDYLLTGDEESLRIAGYMAEFLGKAFPPEKAFVAKGFPGHWTERNAAFPLLGIATYYELTGKKEHLFIASQMVSQLLKLQKQWPDRGGFIHNLYAHDPEEGCRRTDYGGSPFMTGLLLEGIIKYHQLTGSAEARESILLALDWLMKEGISADGDSLEYLTCKARQGESHPDLNLLVAHAFGYGYYLTKDKKYLELGDKLFDRGMREAHLGHRKHISQNYRSSGHYLAYTQEAR